MSYSDNGNRIIQIVVSQRITCRRYRTGKLFVPQIAPLPPDKVTTDIAFKVIWTFQPPATPWWGTFWERLIGSIKHAMDRISLAACTTYEQLATMTHKVQGFMKSRPMLCSCHTTPLTPAHLIFISPLGELPPIRFSLQSKEDALVDYPLLQISRDSFWSESTNEYLP